MNEYLKSMFNKLVKNFEEVVEDLMGKKILEVKDLENYTDRNLHSWLEYALMKAAEKAGLFAIPEVKLQFKNSMDCKSYGLNKKRPKTYKIVDIAFYDETKKLLGVSEIFTKKTAHECFPTKSGLGGKQMLASDSLLHMIENGIEEGLQQIKFIMLVTVLPERYDKEYRPCWKKFMGKINIDKSLVIITETGIESF